MLKNFKKILQSEGPFGARATVCNIYSTMISGSKGRVVNLSHRGPKMEKLICVRVFARRVVKVVLLMLILH